MERGNQVKTAKAMPNMPAEVRLFDFEVLLLKWLKHGIKSGSSKDRRFTARK